MSALRLDITGLAELKERFDGARVREILLDALRDALEPVRAAIAARAPRRKGTLAGSVRVRIGHRKGPIAASIVSTTGYGHLVEKGHRMVLHRTRALAPRRRSVLAARGQLVGDRVPAHPFAAPVARAMQDQVAAAVEARVAAALR